MEGCRDAFGPFIEKRCRKEGSRPNSPSTSIYFVIDLPLTAVVFSLNGGVDDVESQSYAAVLPVQSSPVE